MFKKLNVVMWMVINKDLWLPNEQYSIWLNEFAIQECGLMFEVTLC